MYEITSEIFQRRNLKKPTSNRQQRPKGADQREDERDSKIPGEREQEGETVCLDRLL